MRFFWIHPFTGISSLPVHPSLSNPLRFINLMVCLRYLSWFYHFFFLLCLYNHFSLYVCSTLGAGVMVVIFAIRAEACKNDFKTDLWQSWYLLISFINISKQRKIKLRCRPNVPLADYKRTELIPTCLLAIIMKYVKVHINQLIKV